MKQFFQFLQQYVILKQEVDCNAATEQLWFADLPAHPAIVYPSAASEHEQSAGGQNEAGQHEIGRNEVGQADASHIWLTVPRPQPPVAPDFPHETAPYVSGALDDVNKPPEIKIVHGTLSQDQRLVLMRSWQNYLKAWQVWAEQQKSHQEWTDLYQRLNKLYQRYQRRPQCYEWRMGFGYLTWRTPSGQQAAHHLITLHVQLEQDEQGTFRLFVDKGASVHLEAGQLQPNERPAPSIVQTIEKVLQEGQRNFWEASVLPPLLQTWLNSLSKGGKYSPQWQPQQHFEPQPNIHFAPALLLYPRSQQHLLEAYERCAQQLDVEASHLQGSQGSAALLAFLHQTSQVAKTLPELKLCPEFALPLGQQANENEVLGVLERQAGVVAQVQSGQQQTQVAVNLLTALLAGGQRVLLTAPQEGQLQAVRQAMQGRYAQLFAADLSLEDIQRRIETLTENWQELRHEQESVQQRADEQQQEAQKQLAAAHYQGTLGQIAERLEQEEPQFGWLARLLPDEFPSEPEPPLSDQDALVWWQEQRALSAEEAALLHRQWPKPADLLAPAEFAQFCGAAQPQATPLPAAPADPEQARAHPAYAEVFHLSAMQRQELLQHLSEVEARVQQLYPEWAADYLQQVSKGKAEAWAIFAARAHELMPELQERAEWLMQVQVSGLGDMDPIRVISDAKVMYDHLKAGGKWAGLLGLAATVPAIVKPRLYLRDQVKVRGLPANNPQALFELKQYLRLQHKLQELEKLWLRTGQALDPETKDRVTFLGDQLRALEALQVVVKGQQNTQYFLQRLRLSEAAFYDTNEVNAYRSAVQQAEQDSLQQVSQKGVLQIEQSLQALQQLAGSLPEHTPVAGAIDKLLRAMQAKDAQLYAKAYGQISHFEKQRIQLSGQLLRQELWQDKAPALHQLMLASIQDEAWQERLGQLSSAWHWWRAKAMLAQMQQEPQPEPEKLAQVQGLLQQISQELLLEHVLRRQAEYQAKGQSMLELARYDELAARAEQGAIYDVLLVLGANQVGVEMSFVLGLAQRALLLALADDASDETLPEAPRESTFDAAQLSELSDRYLSGFSPEWCANLRQHADDFFALAAANYGFVLEREARTL